VEGLLKLSRAIDYVNDRFGEVANWLVLFACLISAGNAASRYLFSASSNAWLEVQWYMFAAWCCWAALIVRGPKGSRPRNN
jgi:TRAP-type mannitol/chloroaromatic compound transport system permease small subunit